MHHLHQGLHAHVARDADGTKMIELLKRDDTWSDNVREFIHRPQHNTNSENIKLNIPAGFEKDADTNDSGVATAVSVVYVTVAPSFSGSVLAYVTATAATAQTTDVAAASIAASSSSSSSAAQVNAAAVSTSNSKAALSTISSTVTYTPMVGTPVAQSRSSSAATATSLTDATTQQNAAAFQQSSGLTDGAKAGLAIGIIAAIALFAGLFFFCVKRAKKNKDHDEYNEKTGLTDKGNSIFGAGFVPANKRASADSDKSFGTIHNTATAPRLSLRPVTQFLPQFGEKRKSGNLLAAVAAAGAGSQMSEKPSAWERRPVNGENPFSDAAEEADGRSNHSAKQSWEQTSEPATPRSAQFGTAAAVAVGADAAATSPQRAPNNVHRVQLDFKPSMDDELELKSGQLVRMLHEYDDGWALCVRMDRSQQGVVPRTCLSKTPVKPRGPPPGGRVSPQGQMRGAPQSRPMTPQQSPNVARKPVPGQAI